MDDMEKLRWPEAGPSTPADLCAPSIEHVQDAFDDAAPHIFSAAGSRDFRVQVGEVDETGTEKSNSIERPPVVV